MKLSLNTGYAGGQWASAGETHPHWGSIGRCRGLGGMPRDARQRLSSAGSWLSPTRSHPPAPTCQERGPHPHPSPCRGASPHVDSSGRHRREREAVPLPSTPSRLYRDPFKWPFYFLYWTICQNPGLPCAVGTSDTAAISAAMTPPQRHFHSLPPEVAGNT